MRALSCIRTYQGRKMKHSLLLIIFGFCIGVVLRFLLLNQNNEDFERFKGKIVASKEKWSCELLGTKSDCSDLIMHHIVEPPSKPYAFVGGIVGGLGMDIKIKSLAGDLTVQALSDGIIKNLYIRTNDDRIVKTDKWRRFELLINGEMINGKSIIVTPLCVLIRASHCDDLMHSVSVKAGDIISLSDPDEGIFDPSVTYSFDFEHDKTQDTSIMANGPDPCDINHGPCHGVTK